MKILITGSAGFIGGHLCEALYKAKHDLLLFDLKGGHDVRDRYQVEEIFERERPEVVIHLAALAGVRRGERFPDEYIKTNVIGTLNIARACQRFGVKQLINFSSSSVYGGRRSEPLFGEKLAEDSSTKPLSIYGMSKLMAERIVESVKSDDLLTHSIRPFTVYGDRGRKDQVFMRWIEAIKRGEEVEVYAKDFCDAKKVVRGYTHVDDLVRGVMLLLNSITDETVFNLGGEQAVSLFDLIEIFNKQVKNFRPAFVWRQAGDVEWSVADTNKARLVLGWKPKEDFEKNVKKIIHEHLS